jgi:hypothetical protein
MKSKALIIIIALSMACLIAPIVAAYTPRIGDQFSYLETTQLGNGKGDYSGYGEQATYEGMETITGIDTDGNVAAHYSYSYHWSNSSGSTETGNPSGDFTFSPTSFRYVNGTDDQIGYINPSVWFVMDSSLPVGSTFNLLNTPMTIISTNHSYYLPSQGKYVLTIYAEGTSSYQRNDVYGQFTATYTWQTYFDPFSGYIVGYDYNEHDTNPTASFTYTENLYVNTASYQLTAAPSPSPDQQTTVPTSFFTFSPGNPNPSIPVFFIFLAIVAFLAIVIIIALVIYAVSRSGRRPLPQHAYQQPPPPPGPPPENYNLTPNQQPPVQQVVVREVVKVKCRYCGALIDSTAETCPICGAPRT